MRKLIFIVAVGLLTSSIMQAQVTLGVRGGINLAKIVGKAEETSVKTDMLTAFQGGITLELPISENLSIEPALLLSQKGGVYIDNDEGEKTIGRRNYLDIPLNILAKFPIGDNETKIYGNAGPYIGYMLSANSVIKGGANTNYSADAAYLKKLDYGLNIGVGAELKKFVFGVQYGIGLANVVDFEKVAKEFDMDPADFKGAKSVNRVFSISVGYKFRRD